MVSWCPIITGAVATTTLCFGLVFISLMKREKSVLLKTILSRIPEGLADNVPHLRKYIAKWKVDDETLRNVKNVKREGTRQ